MNSLDGQKQISVLKAMFKESERLNKSKDALIENLFKKLTSLEDSVRLNNKHTYGSKSQKRKCKKTDSDDHTKNKDNFDGTQGCLNGTSRSPKKSYDEDEVESEKKQKEARQYRKGKEYRAMAIDK